ncbi:AcrR family transcriptional regulator [Spinactinospora alkalitolerans]|uniref:AcrR family transcriptional regulator n=1 Tax=Spinactinospora alkalitolerans TaxID=687207 RepID=A0A852TXR5_9ACTN|nr:TetR/AcrR family transcriptional regulator [Spinactinospora alkalitolerans]NYE47613.1 AcrR family transcriptional regulator [Spinactinospora alkalitolerans]
MDADRARERVLDAAEALFYRRGVQAVGMDAIRAEAGVSLKRLYQCFPAKNTLVADYLQRRDHRWRAALAEHVESHAGRGPRTAAVFGYLAAWFASPDFRGCAFINAFGELGGSEAVARAARDHKERLREDLTALLRQDGAASPETAAAHLLLLIDGAIVSAATGLNPRAAQDAQQAAAALLGVLDPDQDG